MLEREDIRQNAIVRRLRSGTVIEQHDQLGRGKEYGVAFWSSRIEAHRLDKRDAKVIEAAKSSCRERGSADFRTHQYSINTEDVLVRTSNRELIAIVRAYVALLPKRQRDVIAKCGLAGHSFRDYAQSVGITERSAASLWYRAIESLRNMLSWTTDDDARRVA